MPALAALDVVIGLVFIYLIASLIASVIAPRFATGARVSSVTAPRLVC